MSRLCGDSNLLPGVEPQRGDAHLFDFLLSGSKQQVPVRPGWKRNLQRRNAGLHGAPGPVAHGCRATSAHTCRARAARKMQAHAMVSGWNLTNTLVLRLSFM